jgi:uncharacterized protein YlxP (DUF503 family)
MKTGVLILELQIPGCTSLKEKRSRLKPLLSRLHREFNISAAEVERQDAWQAAVIACAVVSNDAAHSQRVLQQVLEWLERDWPDVEIVENKIEII